MQLRNAQLVAVEQAKKRKIEETPNTIATTQRGSHLSITGSSVTMIPTTQMIPKELISGFGILVPMNRALIWRERRQGKKSDDENSDV